MKDGVAIVPALSRSEGSGFRRGADSNARNLI